MADDFSIGALAGIIMALFLFFTMNFLIVLPAYTARGVCIGSGYVGMSSADNTMESFGGKNLVLCQNITDSGDVVEKWVSYRRD